MDSPSNTALLLHGFDDWVHRHQPSCEVASVVLRCLRKVICQLSGAACQKIPSIPLLIIEEWYGRKEKTVVVSDPPGDSLLQF